MATGISVNAGCGTKWEEMKLKHKYSFVTFKVENDKEIVVDEFGETGCGYGAFIKCLPADDCRYAVVEVPETTRIVFVMWTPDLASVKGKMIYASTRQGTKNCFLV